MGHPTNHPPPRIPARVRVRRLLLLADATAAYVRLVRRGSFGCFHWSERYVGGVLERTRGCPYSPPSHLLPLPQVLVVSKTQRGAGMARGMAAKITPDFR
ncbi:hypothetical protein KOW79_019109 [Hemibagrus wyckioides]|uniref:Uncharacterized protein n=1 Tax=Hemibagrus wyckioides TaxID=337641 RepID=A0A9D3NB07_9TELE|nr:hypothetical protein KOW79_019109 [Hemibagrus wyckioides]